MSALKVASASSIEAWPERLFQPCMNRGSMRRRCLTADAHILEGLTFASAPHL